jgi:glycosyltransferase involved in cell wall biosynthesis
MKQQRLLLFAYFYPPLGGPAVQRPLKMIKYLHQLGWETDVITVKDIVYHSRDESLLKENKAAGVYRTGSADAMSILKKTAEKNKFDAGRIYFRTPEFLKKIVRSSFFIDDKYGWMKYALKQARELCEENDYSAVMATIGPYTSALAAYKIHEEFNLPLIIDYRDHWTLNPYLKYLTLLHKYISHYWEKKIVEQSSMILTVGKRMAEELQAEFDNIPSNNFQVMYNGWDEQDFDQISDQAPSAGNFVISYLGGLYGKRSARYFIQALEELKDEHKLPQNLRVRFIGNYYRETRSLFDSEKLHDILEIIPQVEHWKALELMQQSDLLLLFSPSDTLKSGVTGKIFEYIRSGKNILGMVPEDSESADLLLEHGYDNICSMEDVIKIKQLLNKILQNNNESNISKPKNCYSRKHQVSEFATKLGLLI